MPDQSSRTGDRMHGVFATPVQGTDGGWWDEFFTDRSKPIPFFVDWPDENLAEWLSNGLLGPGRVLEFGCGNGRNSTYLASQGCAVEAIDFSALAIGWASERAARTGVLVSFQHCSIFDAQFTAGSYDLVYDSGCFHHLPPHRRNDYADLVHAALRPGGSYGLVCFRPEGGSGYTDQQGLRTRQPRRRSGLLRRRAARPVGHPALLRARAPADEPNRRAGAVLRTGFLVGTSGDAPGCARGIIYPAQWPRLMLLTRQNLATDRV
jgi:SAM-dependent methyltransferase